MTIIQSMVFLSRASISFVVVELYRGMSLCEIGQCIVTCIWPLQTHKEREQARLIVTINPIQFNSISNLQSPISNLQTNKSNNIIDDGALEIVQPKESSTDLEHHLVRKPHHRRSIANVSNHEQLQHAAVERAILGSSHQVMIRWRPHEL